MKPLSESAQEYFLEKPERIISVGSMFSTLGLAQLMAGAYGKVATTAINIIPTLAKQPESTKTLADIYPFAVVWFVPESIGGFLFSAMILISGLSLIGLGQQLIRFSRH